MERTTSSNQLHTQPLVRMARTHQCTEWQSCLASNKNQLPLHLNTQEHYSCAGGGGCRYNTTHLYYSPPHQQHLAFTGRANVPKATKQPGPLQNALAAKPLLSMEGNNESKRMISAGVKCSMYHPCHSASCGTASLILRYRPFLYPQVYDVSQYFSKGASIRTPHQCSGASIPDPASHPVMPAYYPAPPFCFLCK